MIFAKGHVHVCQAIGISNSYSYPLLQNNSVRKLTLCMDKQDKDVENMVKNNISHRYYRAYKNGKYSK